MREKAGISLISLIVIIIVILILASIAILSGVGSIKETSKTKLDVEIRSLKDAVSNRMTENARNPSKYPLIGQKVDDITAYLPYISGLSNTDIQNISMKITAENIDYFRLVDATAASALGAEAIDPEHYFVVNYENGDVYGSIDMRAYEAARSTP